ncbi:MAG: septal ring lytic transglycosylase RlpA family protein [Nitrospirota bacterium]|nr:septal ring lytic transglycosylase RlpA family protein [Nitrospirota bacterium]
MFLQRIAILALIAILSGCAAVPRPTEPPPPGYYTKKGTQKPYKIDGKWYTPLDSAYNFEETGIASWYGKAWHGRKTSTGEPYDMYAMTAAHKTLPMGTWVRVTRQDNDKETIVKINDRGPFVEGRVIDLSYKAASELGIVGKGLARVKLVALGSTEGDTLVKQDYQHGKFYVQVGAFTVKDNADRLKEKLDERLLTASISTYDRGDAVFYRVRIGTLSTIEDAERLKKRLDIEGMKSFVVAD